jgi:hypothetical protein
MNKLIKLQAGWLLAKLMHLVGQKCVCWLVATVALISAELLLCCLQDRLLLCDSVAFSCPLQGQQPGGVVGVPF